MVECGLLPGTFLRHLLSTGLVTERLIRTIDLVTAEHIFIGYSVRGLPPATLV